MEKQGKVKVFYRKNGGIVFTDEPNKWYNPDRTYIDWEETSTSKGDNITITLNEQGYYTNIKVNENSNESNKEINEKKEVIGPDWDAKERRIIRMNSWSHAVEILKLMHEDNDVPSFDDLKKIAERIEEHIYR